MELKKVVVILLMAIFLTGCSTKLYYHGVQAVYPKNPSLRQYGEVVPSLKPTFIWNGKNDRKYDLIVWEVIAAKSENDIFTGLGDPVIYAKAIKGTNYTSEKELLPNSPYYWSVRQHGDTEWSYYDTTYFVFTPNLSLNIPYRLFSFCTPIK